MRARHVVIGGIAVGLIAWLFRRRRSSTVPSSVPATASSLQSYAALNRLDLEAVSEFTAANREAMEARAAGDTARAAAALDRYRAAYARHQELHARALAAWNRENGVTSG